MPNGQAALVVSQTANELDIVNPATGKVDKTVTVGKLPHWIGLLSGAHTAYVTDENSNELSVVNLDSDTVTATIAIGNGPRKIVVQPAQS